MTRSRRVTWWVLGPALTALILAAALAELFVAVDQLRSFQRGNDLLGFDLVLLACIPLLFRRRQPVVALAVSGTAVLALALLGYQALSVTAVLFVAVAAVAHRSRFRWVVTGTVFALGVATVVGVLGESSGDIVALSVGVVVGLAIGLTARAAAAAKTVRRGGVAATTEAASSVVGSRHEPSMSEAPPEAPSEAPSAAPSDAVSVAVPTAAARRWWDYRPAPLPPWPEATAARAWLGAGCAAAILVANAAVWFVVVQSPAEQFAQRYCAAYASFNRQLTAAATGTALRPVVEPTLVAQRTKQAAPLEQAATTTSELARQAATFAAAEPNGSPSKALAQATADQMAILAARVQGLRDEWENLPIDTREHYFSGATALAPRLSDLLFALDPSPQAAATVPTGSRLAAALRVDSQCRGIHVNR